MERILVHYPAGSDIYMIGAYNASHLVTTDQKLKVDAAMELGEECELTLLNGTKLTCRPGILGEEMPAKPARTYVEFLKSD